MESLGRLLILAGLILLLVGGGLLLAAKLGVHLGSLPGDIRIERDGGTFFFPLGTALLVSFVLTLVLNIVVRLLK